MTPAPPRAFPVTGKGLATHEWMIEHPKTGMLLVLVAGGKFLAGESGSDEGGGKFEVELPGFYMGLHPVTNRQYGVFVKESGHHAPVNGFWQDSGKAEHPVVCVSWEDAAAYCVWGGLRLPGELEWEKAARGEDGRKYPWGEEWDEGKCRNAKNNGSEETAGVWSYAGGASLSGAYQMSGNVWEWCVDWYDEKAYERYQRGDLKPPSSGSTRVLRGGSWIDFYFGYFAASVRRHERPGLLCDRYGFRCASVVGASP